MINHTMTHTLSQKQLTQIAEYKGIPLTPIYANQLSDQLSTHSTTKVIDPTISQHVLLIIDNILSTSLSQKQLTQLSDYTGVTPLVLNTETTTDGSVLLDAPAQKSQRFLQQQTTYVHSQ